MGGSLFDDGTPWNLAELETLLSKGLGDAKIPGVTNPYLYVGSWKSMFGWHKEDLDLYSVNYLHHGAPKFWYSVDLDCNRDFEEFMQESFPANYRRCHEFIRHKGTLVHPNVLLGEGIRMVKCQHNPGEFMISRAAAYHQGFNFGFNIAEAVNFALKDWLPTAATVSFCKCISDSVNIDVRKFATNLRDAPGDYLPPGAFEEFLAEAEADPALSPEDEVVDNAT